LFEYVATILTRLDIKENRLHRVNGIFSSKLFVLEYLKTDSLERKMPLAPELQIFVYRESESRVAQLS